MNYIDKTVILENGRKMHFTKDVSKMSLKEANKMLDSIRQSLFDGPAMVSTGSQVKKWTVRQCRSR